MSIDLIAILGPTATGKTRLGVHVAQIVNGEIISADSRQVYRELNIGTGKDLTEYSTASGKIPYHCIDIAEPFEEYNIYHYQRDFISAFTEILEHKKIPVLVGGSGLYLSAVLERYELIPAEFKNQRIEELSALSIDQLAELLRRKNPNLHNTTDLLDKKRLINALIILESSEQGIPPLVLPKLNPLIIYIDPPREVIRERISKRLYQRLDEGMIDEVRELVGKGISYEKLNFFGLEYRYISLYLQNQITYKEMVEQLRYAIFNFAKRQSTWFRKMEKKLPMIKIPDANINLIREILDNTELYNT